ncbi:MAG TPA: hypothetical protein VE953_00820 [Terriglobales bacterium]|nr:hypothetical protein [Terriglobales bacterium]
MSNVLAQGAKRDETTVERTVEDDDGVNQGKAARQIEARAQRGRYAETTADHHVGRIQRGNMDADAGTRTQSYTGGRRHLRAAVRVDIHAVEFRGGAS